MSMIDEQMMKKLAIAIENLKLEVDDWIFTQKRGCNDPFWSDGANINLIRNHIIYYKNEIAEICQETGEELPSEYYLPTPPVVDNNYMANLEQKERVKRLRHDGTKLTRKCPEYDWNQLSLL